MLRCAIPRRFSSRKFTKRPNQQGHSRLCDALLTRETSNDCVTVTWSARSDFAPLSARAYLVCGTFVVCRFTYVTEYRKSFLPLFSPFACPQCKITSAMVNCTTIKKIDARWTARTFAQIWIKRRIPQSVRHSEKISTEVTWDWGVTLAHP